MKTQNKIILKMFKEAHPNLVVINHDGKTNKTTWIRRTQRNMATGEMKWEQISNKNYSQ